MILRGKIFISTVSADKSLKIRSVFEPLGATLIDFPMIEVVKEETSAEMKVTLREIEKFQWIIFTSIKGVKYFHDLLFDTINLSSIPPCIKVAAVGPETGLEIKKNGREADFTGSGNSADDLVSELIDSKLVQGSRVLLPLGNLAPDAIQERLSEISFPLRINVYKTLKTEDFDIEPIERIKNNSYDLVLITSPSAVSNLAEIIGPRYLTPGLRFASIGEVTSRAAEQFGIRCLITSGTSTYSGLAREIQNYYKIKN